MTAEVAIINAGAVAIAADSAVTIGQQKIYNSALKVFSLSKVAPVGIMVYGNAGLLNVPWEPLLKAYREELADFEFDSLAEYADDFFDFIAKHKRFFPTDAKSGWIQGSVGSYYLYMRGEVEKRIREIVKRTGSVTDARTRAELNKVVDRHHKALSNTARLPAFTRAFETSIRRKYLSLFRVAKDDIFENLSFSRSYLTKLYDIASYICTRDVFSQSTSGIVVAGFGSEDVFPSVLTHKLEGIIDGKLKCKREESKCVEIVDPTQCAIVPFAQEDMVDTFMQGWNPAIQNFVLRYISQLLNRFPDLIDDTELQGKPDDKKNVRQRLQRDTRKLFRDFNSQLADHVQKEHVDPILNMVGVLPKDELAAMAESLVNLTAFKRKITHDMETVGGPIDVAVISKGDGLVWVKRKHYFPAELNQHFFANYFRSSPE